MSRTVEARANGKVKWSDQWATPPEFFGALDAEFHFMLDACADDWSAKCERFYVHPDKCGVCRGGSPLCLACDGLRGKWRVGAVWLNPPYSNIGPWLEKAYLESRRGAVVVALVPCTPDRKWWAEYVEGRCEVRYVTRNTPGTVAGRVAFIANEAAPPRRAPFPSAILIYRSEALSQAGEA